MRSATTLALFLVLGQLNATEKYWVAYEATLIVVGSVHPSLTVPWFDGWHVTGTIVVDEVLYGHRPTGEVRFRFVGGYRCSGWSPPQFSRVSGDKWLWFLKTSDQKTWESSLGCPDAGFRDVSERRDFESYIRLYKQ